MINVLIKLINLFNLIDYPSLVYVIGSMGTGKTTLSMLVYSMYFKEKGFKSVLMTSPENFYDFITNIKNETSKYYILFDDFSFTIDPRSKSGREFLTMLFRIRHILKTNYVVLWFNGHYSYSLAPFIRSTPYRILTSISEPEIRQYSAGYIFTEKVLWDYFKWCRDHMDKRIVLASFRGITKIIDVTTSKRKLNKAKKDFYENCINCDNTL